MKGNRGPIKMFCFLQRHLNLLGVHAPEAFKEFNSLNLKNYALLICEFLFFIMSAIYLFHDAQTVNEVSNGIFSCSASLAIVCAIIVLLWQSPNMFKLIESFEIIIQKRML